MFELQHSTPLVEVLGILFEGAIGVAAELSLLFTRHVWFLAPLLLPFLSHSYLSSIVETGLDCLVCERSFDLFLRYARLADLATEPRDASLVGWAGVGDAELTIQTLQSSGRWGGFRQKWPTVLATMFLCTSPGLQRRLLSCSVAFAESRFLKSAILHLCIYDGRPDVAFTAMQIQYNLRLNTRLTYMRCASYLRSSDPSLVADALRMIGRGGYLLDDDVPVIAIRMTSGSDEEVYAAINLAGERPEFARRFEPALRTQAGNPNESIASNAARALKQLDK